MRRGGRGDETEKRDGDRDTKHLMLFCKRLSRSQSVAYAEVQAGACRFQHPQKKLVNG